jgi:hypothetical protein
VRERLRLRGLARDGHGGVRGRARQLAARALLPGSVPARLRGRHHAIFRFTQGYPRDCTKDPPAMLNTVPVTIDWNTGVPLAGDQPVPLRRR